MSPLKTFLLVMGALVVLPWDVSLLPGPIPRLNLQTENTQPLDTPEYTREVLRIPSIEDGIELEAWLYRPKQPVSNPPPVVVMAHGLVRAAAPAAHACTLRTPTCSATRRTCAVRYAIAPTAAGRALCARSWRCSIARAPARRFSVARARLRARSPHTPLAARPCPPTPQGAQKDMGLHNYASRFAAAGLAVFVFDYRTFGGSDGEPRNWISPRRHLQDWRSALAHVRGPLAAAGAVDASSLALWGTSFGGGHAIVMAGELRDAVKAVVAQVRR